MVVRSPMTLLLAPALRQCAKLTPNHFFQRVALDLTDALQKFFAPEQRDGRS